MPDSQNLGNTFLCVVGLCLRNSGVAEFFIPYPDDFCFFYGVSFFSAVQSDGFGNGPADAGATEKKQEHGKDKLFNHILLSP
jgi:hypothetical protein